MVDPFYWPNYSKLIFKGDNASVLFVKDLSVGIVHGLLQRNIDLVFSDIRVHLDFLSLYHLRIDNNEIAHIIRCHGSLQKLIKLVPQAGSFVSLGVINATDSDAALR